MMRMHNTYEECPLNARMHSVFDAFQSLIASSEEPDKNVVSLATAAEHVRSACPSNVQTQAPVDGSHNLMAWCKQEMNSLSLILAADITELESL